MKISSVENDCNERLCKAADSEVCFSRISPDTILAGKRKKNLTENRQTFFFLFIL